MSPRVRTPAYVGLGARSLIKVDRLPIELKATKAKETLYLRIPKDIATLLEINEKTSFTLKIVNEKEAQTLEYEVKNNH